MVCFGCLAPLSGFNWHSLLANEFVGTVPVKKEWSSGPLVSSVVLNIIIIDFIKMVGIDWSAIIVASNQLLVTLADNNRWIGIP